MNEEAKETMREIVISAAKFASLWNYLLRPGCIGREILLPTLEEIERNDPNTTACIMRLNNALKKWKEIDPCGAILTTQSSFPKQNKKPAKPTRAASARRRSKGVSRTGSQRENGTEK